MDWTCGPYYDFVTIFPAAVVCQMEGQDPGWEKLAGKLEL